MDHLTNDLTNALAAQVQVLIQDAPSDNQTKQLVEIVALALATFSQDHFNASHYYLVQDVSGAWLQHTLTHRTQSTVEKTALFIFSTFENASKEIEKLQNSQLFSEKIPIVDLLFRFWTLNLSDVLIFPGDDRQPRVEVTRSQLSQILKQAQSEASSPNQSPKRRSGRGFGKGNPATDVC